MKELSILGGATESFVMLYDKALLQVDGAGRYDVQASLDGEHWSVLTPITAKCDHHSRTIVLDLLAGAHVRVVCVTGTLESARYSFDMGETSEAERIAAEEARVEAENKRVEAENEREVAEEQRKKGEASREVAEAARVTSENARAKAEQGRASAEAVRADAENLRKSAESSRVTAESARVSSEGVRVNAENQRKSAETSRVNAESARANAETNRVSTEAARVNAEKERATAEGVREDNEQARVLAEAERVEAEALREERTDEAIASIANKVDRTDNAPELTSGFAGNLVGRGEATSEEIGFRPSGGLTSVNDGAARIERLKGNTVVWNHLLKPINADNYRIYSSDYGSVEFNNGTAKVTVLAERTNGYSCSLYAKFLIPRRQNHKYLGIITAKASQAATIYMSPIGNHISIGTEWRTVVTIGAISASSINIAPFIGITETTPVGTIVELKDAHMYDLTRMFGAGNEPTTIEEFNARKPLGIDEYAYNEGELISTTADEIKSVGFNAWDEEREVGAFNSEGNPISSAGCIRTKNSIRILPNTSYYLKSNNKWLVVFFFDDQGNLIKSAEYRDMAVITPTNAHYMKFRTDSSYGETYNHDICIHLVHTGYRNGEYEPYEEFRRSLPISEIKDSEGNALFPNGLLSAGSVYDEITATKAIKRIGVVDMGSLEWAAEPTHSAGVYRMRCSALRSIIKNNSSVAVVPQYIICSKYSAISPNNTYGYPSFIGNGITVEQDGSLTLYDTAHNSQSSAPSPSDNWLSGVMLYYELAEPIEVDLPEPINMDYEVSDFGTEEVISDTPTTPLKADIIYQFNAVDRIRENSANIKKIEEKLDDISVDLLTPITYSSLKALRDGGSLVKGMWYRITDYVTTTVQSQTKSANHPFDVIVLATSENELSHLARAIAHDGDTYFDGNNLGAWELWYDLDNDTTKYEWADATNGKGVIYRMIDEKRNDCPYDFKNVLFYNDKYTSNTTSDKYYYTFSYVVSGKLYDGTVEKQVTNCYGNSMGVYSKSKKRSLNINVWRNLGFGNSCHSNTFGDNCFSNTCEYNYHSNTFGNHCNSNTFGGNCCYNTFGGDCHHNTFGDYCQYNTFGNTCNTNTFGDNCSYNTIGNGCSTNTFGDYCQYNTLGNGCSTNTFGDYFETNTFGNNCNYCGFYNSSDFDYNEDVGGYLGTGTPINEVMNCRFGEGCSNLLIHTTDGVKNLFVSQNLYSLKVNEDYYTLPEVIEVDEYGDYELKIARNRDGEIKVYCEADLV